MQYLPCYRLLLLSASCKAAGLSRAGWLHTAPVPVANAYPVRRGAPAPAAAPARTLPKTISHGILQPPHAGVTYVNAEAMPGDELDAIRRCLKHAQ